MKLIHATLVEECPPRSSCRSSFSTQLVVSAGALGRLIASVGVSITNLLLILVLSRSIFLGDQTGIGVSADHIFGGALSLVCSGLLDSCLLGSCFFSSLTRSFLIRPATSFISLLGLLLCNLKLFSENDHELHLIWKVPATPEVLLTSRQNAWMDDQSFSGDSIPMSLLLHLRLEPCFNFSSLLQITASRFSLVDSAQSS